MQFGQLIGIFFLLTVIKGYEAVIIEVTNTVTIFKEDITITCRAASTGNLNYINNIQIYRNNSVDNKSLLVTVSYDRGSTGSLINWQNQGLKLRAVAEGDVHNPNPDMKFLRLQILANMTRCYDEGRYFCSLHAQTTSGQQYDEEASADVIVNSEPDRMDNIQITSRDDNYVDPLQGLGRFPLGHVVQMTCMGTVGKPPTQFRWCIKEDKDTDFMVLNYFAANVSHSDVTLVNNCNYQRSSTLMYTVSSIDTQSVLLCEPETELYCGINTLNRTFTVEKIKTGTYPTNKAPLNNISMTMSIIVLFIFSCIRNGINF